MPVPTAVRATIDGSGVCYVVEPPVAELLNPGTAVGASAVPRPPAMPVKKA